MFLEGQESHTITINLEIVDSLKEFDRIKKMASSLS
jgi:hypothetical protein